MSGESNKRPPDPNATIQLDAIGLEGVELRDSSAPIGEKHEPQPAARETPPPLPDLSPTHPSTAPPAPLGLEEQAVAAGSLGAPGPSRPLGKTFVYGAMFVVLVALAIVAGLNVGRSAREKLSIAPGESATASRPAMPAAAPMPPAGSASASTLTLPTIEIK